MTIYEEAKAVIEQLQNHDRFRELPGENVIWPNGREPNDIAMAREVVRLTDLLKRIAELGDRQTVACTATYPDGVAGWRRVEAMREIAVEAIGNERTGARLEWIHNESWSWRASEAGSTKDGFSGKWWIYLGSDGRYEVSGPVPTFTTIEEAQAWCQKQEDELCQKT